MNKDSALSASDMTMETTTIKLPKVDFAHKSGYECAMDDIREGRVSEHASVEEYFERILG